MQVNLQCPSCNGDDLGKHGTQQGKQIYSCKNSECPINTFKLSYVYEITDEFNTIDAENQMPASIQCPSCNGENIRKFGKRGGKQIYRCNNGECPRTTFRQKYVYQACNPKVKSRINDLKASGNSTRAIGRMLSVSKDTVANAVKKQN